MYLGKEEYVEEICFKKRIINRVDHFKYLGITIDFNLNWHKNLDYLEKK